MIKEMIVQTKMYFKADKKEILFDEVSFCSKYMM